MFKVGCLDVVMDFFAAFEKFVAVELFGGGDPEIKGTCSLGIEIADQRWRGAEG